MPIAPGLDPAVMLLRPRTQPESQSLAEKEAARKQAKRQGDYPAAVFTQKDQLGTHDLSFSPFRPFPCATPIAAMDHRYCGEIQYAIALLPHPVTEVHVLSVQEIILVKSANRFQHSPAA